MKKIFIIIVLVASTVVIFGQDIPAEELGRQINIAREEKGLDRLPVLYPLSELAEQYTFLLDMENRLSHDILSVRTKQILILDMLLRYNYEQFIYNSTSEVIARFPLTMEVTPTMAVRSFDSSPEHSSVTYSDKVVAMGWDFYRGENAQWVCAYFIMED
jgi:hypothetical protein